MREQYGGRPVLTSFIVFEGLDGSGTTTQANRLVEFLKSRGERALFTCEPSTFLTGKTIRNLLNGPEYAQPATMAHLFAADRNEHIYRPDTGILSLLSRGYIVVSDRFLFSSLAYQGVITDPVLVNALNGAFPLPEHLIYIDLEPEVAERRMVSRGEGDIYENLPFQRKVHDAYKEVLDRFVDTAMKIHRVEGTVDPDSVFLQIKKALNYR